mmetsp:Transcript_26883/g.86347  ORF Transcript_26883/g.86347 Transcript_26883/m.86347 type:complete len:276 (+) Transcript_26883:1305-2132(+)
MPEHESAYRSFMLSLRPSDAAQFLKTRASAESFVSSSYVSSSPSSPPSPKASTTDATKHCCIRGRGFARSLGATAKTLGPAPAMAWSMTCLARASGPARQKASGRPSPALTAASGICTDVGRMVCCSGIGSVVLPGGAGASCGTKGVVGAPAVERASAGSFVRWSMLVLSSSVPPCAVGCAREAAAAPSSAERRSEPLPPSALEPHAPPAAGASPPTPCGAIGTVGRMLLPTESIGSLATWCSAIASCVLMSPSSVSLTATSVGSRRRSCGCCRR